MATDSLANPNSSHQPAGLELLSRGVIQEHMEEISELDRHALLDVLVPHRRLPDYDPAGYVIKAHDESRATAKGVEVHDSYDIGVAFGRSLMVKAAGKHPDANLPVVDSELNPEKQKLVDEYLRRARSTRLSRLLRNDREMHPDIQEAAGLFAQRCQVVIPDKMLDKPEPLLRGLHDYLSVIDILESTEERLHLRKRLGGIMLLGGMFLGYRILHRLESTSKG
jgi:hypothetical protein